MMKLTSKTAKLLRFMCRCLGVVFSVLASFFVFLFLFGLLLMRHLEDAAEVWRRCKGFGMLFIACFAASCAMHATAELISWEVKR